MSRMIHCAVVLVAAVYASAASAQATSRDQSSTEAAWRARRAADSVCATHPRTVSSTTRGLVRRDPVTGTECRKSVPPTLTAYVLTDHLVCPSDTPWTDTNPLTLLKPERIARLDIRRDSVTLAKWRCPSPVDAVVIVTAKPPTRS